MPQSETAWLEKRRRKLQEFLDAEKDQAERNRLGQFATPPGLAVDVLRQAWRLLGRNGRVRFIDPAIGTGAFYSALLEVFSQARVEAATGYEIDPHYGLLATKIWNGTGLDLRLEDFTRAKAPPDRERYDLLICNPPYVRHHHIARRDKRRLKAGALRACGEEIGGLAGLYCYFLGLGHAWMADGGLAGWLVPSEFMDVNYGAPVKRYLLDRVTLLHVHRFDPNDVQFGDALVSSAVVWFRKAAPPAGHEVRFTCGGSLVRPRLEGSVPADTLRRDPKWTGYPMKEGLRETTVPVLDDFFRIKRGLVTGSNSYFILSAEEIDRRGLPREAFSPILPDPRFVPGNEILADTDGNPVLERRLFVLDCLMQEDQIKLKFPALSAYLEEGKARGIAKRYVCRHRRLWYRPERRPPAPFVGTYLGRGDAANGRPFRFILNHSRATAANVYLMLYPDGTLAHALRREPALQRKVWESLNRIDPVAMLGEGRAYGGGLYKLEPKELGNVPAVELARMLDSVAEVHRRPQGELFADTASG